MTMKHSAPLARNKKYVKICGLRVVFYGFTNEYFVNVEGKNTTEYADTDVGFSDGFAYDFTLR